MGSVHLFRKYVIYNLHGSKHGYIYKKRGTYVSLGIYVSLEIAREIFNVDWVITEDERWENSHTSCRPFWEGDFRVETYWWDGATYAHKNLGEMQTAGAK